MGGVRVRLGEPVTVTYQPKEYAFDWVDWGYYQFPSIGRTEEGTLVCRCNVCEDNLSAFGKSGTTRSFVSEDGGETWTPSEEKRICLRLPDGTCLATTTVPAPDPWKIPDLEAPLYDAYEEVVSDDPGAEKHFRRETYWSFRRAPEALRTWSYLRKAPGGQWQLRQPAPEMPEDAVLMAYHDRMLQYMFEHIKRAPDGRVWGYYYPFRANGWKGKPGECPTFFVSEDEGETFRYLSRIPYDPDPRFDDRRFPAIRGFTEPDVEFLPGGAVVCLLRTHVDDVKSPSYICHSYDNGATWGKPRVFDEELGVFPQLLRLGCGVTLASYGRPGVYLRATDDPAAEVWQPRVPVLDSGYTCSYTGLLPVGDASALLVYSDFGRIQADGKPHKSILVRRIDVE